MTWVLATTDDKVKWYAYKHRGGLQKGEYVLLDQLDLKKVPLCGNKETAKQAANALGLTTWRYVKI